MRPQEKPDQCREVRLRRKRRAATAMEYLVCITFILTVVIFAVQAFGVNTGKLFQSNANATSVTGKTP